MPRGDHRRPLYHRSRRLRRLVRVGGREAGGVVQPLVATALQQPGVVLEFNDLHGRFMILLLHEFISLFYDYLFTFIYIDALGCGLA